MRRETFSRTPINYSEGMAEDQKDCYIQYLAEQNQEHLLTKKAMELVLEDFVAGHKVLEDRMAAFESEYQELKNQLSEERKLRKSAERKVRTLQEQLDYVRQERFADRRQKVRKKTESGEPKKPEPDRRDEKDDFDGTEGTFRTDSVDNNQCNDVPDLPKNERDLSNRPDQYNTMSVVGDPIFHPSDLSKASGRIIERKSVQIFSLKTCLIEERFEMVHYAAPSRKPKWGYFPSEGHPEVVTRLKGRRLHVSSYRPSLMKSMSRM